MDYLNVNIYKEDNINIVYLFIIDILSIFIYWYFSDIEFIRVFFKSGFFGREKIF